MKARNIFLCLGFIFLMAIQGIRSQDNKFYYGEAEFVFEEGSSVTLRSESVEVKDLPVSIDLSDRFPPAGDQGDMSSCWAWATTYAYFSYLRNGSRPERFVNSDRTPNYQNIFSPAFTYHLYKSDSLSCYSRETSLEILGRLLKDGAVTFNYFPYDDSKCSIPVPSALIQHAKTASLPNHVVTQTRDLGLIKKTLSEGTPLVFSINIDNTFKRIGDDWDSSQKNPPMWDSYGRRDQAHAMVMVGYNDGLSAFKVLNSWGESWGDRGFIWISYDIMQNHLSYACYPVKVPRLREGGSKSYIAQDDGELGDGIRVGELQPLSTWVKKNYYRKYNDLKFALIAFNPRKGYALIKVMYDKNTELRRLYIEEGQKLDFFIRTDEYELTFHQSGKAGKNPLKKAMFFTIQTTN